MSEHAWYFEHIEKLKAELKAFKAVSVALQAEITALKAEVKEWESGALVRGWREERADLKQENYELKNRRD